jgi:hypothetical protein
MGEEKGRVGLASFSARLEMAALFTGEEMEPTGGRVGDCSSAVRRGEVAVVGDWAGDWMVTAGGVARQAGARLSTSTGWLSESTVSSTGLSTALSSSLPDCSDCDCGTGQ